MRKTRVIAIAALLAAGSSLPALAEWNHVGDIQVSPDQYSNVQLGAFTGPVDQIRLHSAGRANCDNVRVIYENGDTQEIFSGAILDGQDQTISFPDRSRRLEAVSLDCRAAYEGGAHIAVAADMPYGTTGGAVRYAPVAAPPVSDMVLLASRDFGDLNQRSLMLSNTESRPVQTIALEPIGADARCRTMSTQFDDGSISRTVPNGGAELQEGHIYRSFVDSGGRDLNNINLTCEAANGDHVKINVYAMG